MAPGLLGPPELHSTTTVSATVDSPSTNKSQPSITTPTSYTSTGNPCLDFFHVAPETPPQELIQRLQLSYLNNPIKTLKLIFNLRGVRHVGKNDKEGFYASALWLHKNHPKTLANNIQHVASFGSLKDLLEILFRVVEGLDARKRLKDAWEVEKPNFFAKRYNNNPKSKLSELDEKKRKAVKSEKKAVKAKKAVDRYTHDPEYKYLYDCVCDVFAELLRNDIKLINDGNSNNSNRNKISLAAKWCPSLDSSYDEYLLICETISKKIFPREEYVEYRDIDEAHYAYRVRTRLRKEILVPLRKVLDLPEVKMCAKRWRDINYENVSSLAMHLRKRVFIKRDLNGFEEYLEDVNDGESSICAGALLPHLIIGGVSDDGLKSDEVSGLQWKRMVDDLSKGGTGFVNCVAVCDNLGSEVCVALVLLLSELTGEPWKGKIVSTDPFVSGLVEIQGEKLDSKVDFLQGIGSGKLDLHGVFDRVLEFAVEKGLRDDEMIKRLFVFTEMEIGQVWEEEYSEIQGKFIEKGYLKVPEVVFWNVKSSGGVPVRCDQTGVAVVSGFSKNLLTLLLQELGELTPEAVMDAAVSRPEYDLLVVHD